WHYPAAPRRSYRHRARRSGTALVPRAAAPRMLAQRPRDVLAHELGGVVPARFERRDDVRVARGVAERDGEVPEPALVARAPDRAAFGARAPVVLAPAEEIDERARVERVARREIRGRLPPRELVPRAEDLAVVAAEDAIADRLPQLHGDRTPELDRQIRNAAARVELVGRDDGAGRTDVDAGRAAAAMRRHGLVGGQRQIRQDLAEQEVRPGVAVEQV